MAGEDSLEDLFEGAEKEPADEASGEPPAEDPLDHAEDAPAATETPPSTDRAAPESEAMASTTDGSDNNEAGTDAPSGDGSVVDLEPRSDSLSVPTTSRLTTGIDALDACLDGGIPPGRILGLLAPPDTQAELLVKHLAANHDCLYLSTLRPKWEVEEEVADFVQRSAVDRAGVTDVRIEQLSPDGRLEDARGYVAGVEEPSIIVLDSVNELEQAETARYTRFLDDLKERLWQTGSVAILYGIEDPEPPRGRTITLRRSDLVWQLRRSVSAEAIEHLLVMSKFRSGRALSEPIRLELTDDVAVDSGTGTEADVGTVLDGALDD